VRGTAWKQRQKPPKNDLASMLKVSVLSAAEVLQESRAPPLAVAKADPAASAAVLWLMGWRVQRARWKWVIGMSRWGNASKL